MPDITHELTDCRICPRNCHTDRTQTTGYCGANQHIKVNLHQLHFGEEPVLSGANGSGTIFFSHCNLRCVFCQNHTISALGWGNEISYNACIDMMLELQAKGAHNINLVTPGHYNLQLIDIIRSAKSQGLQIPVVWNTNAYEKVDALKSLEGLVDIYLPDLKYANDLNGMKYSNVPDYTKIARRAIIEMKRQVGRLQCEDEIAVKGMIIRLLVLPEDIAGTVDSLHWIADALGEDTYISLMAQYYPTWQAKKYPEINRGITQKEYDEVLNEIIRMDFTNVFIQELSCSNEWTPDFRETESGLKGKNRI